MRVPSIRGIAIRKLGLVLVCSTLVAADLEPLRQLTQDKRFFVLRRELQNSGASSSATLFYRGVVASRFGREEEGVGLLREFLATNPAPELARQAQQEIAAACVRMGWYGEAMRSSPDADPLIASLRDVPPESVENVEGRSIQAARNRLGSWDVPVQVNGVDTQLIFDTGANFSAVSESEARRLGLSIRDSQATVAGVTENKNPVRVACADLAMGGAHIRNVVFLVFTDRAMYCCCICECAASSGASGHSRAWPGWDLARWHGSHPPRPEPAVDGPGEEPNLFFDSLNPVVEFPWRAPVAVGGRYGGVFQRVLPIVPFRAEL